MVTGKQPGGVAVVAGVPRLCVGTGTAGPQVGLGPGTLASGLPSLSVCGNGVGVPAPAKPSAPGKKPNRLSKLQFSIWMMTRCSIGVVVAGPWRPGEPLGAAAVRPSSVAPTTQSRIARGRVTIAPSPPKAVPCAPHERADASGQRRSGANPATGSLSVLYRPRAAHAARIA